MSTLTPVNILAASRPIVADPLILNLPEDLLQKIFIFAMDDASDFRAISLTCRSWDTLVKDETTLKLFLRAASPIFLTERVSSLSVLNQYKFYTSSYINASHLVSMPEFDDIFMNRKRHLHMRCYFKKLLEFSDHLDARRGHEKISVDSFNFFETYDSRTGKALFQAKINEAEEKPKTSFFFSAVSNITNFFVRKQKKKAEDKPKLSRLEHFDWSLQRSSRQNISTANDSEKILCYIYEKMRKLLGETVDGKNAFLDREGCSSSGAQKAEAVRSYVLLQLDNLADPRLFLTKVGVLKLLNVVSLSQEREQQLNTELCFQMHLILKDQAPEGVLNFGELAYAGREGYNATNEQRWLAVVRTLGFDPRLSHNFISLILTQQ